MTQRQRNSRTWTRRFGTALGASLLVVAIFIGVEGAVLRWLGHLPIEEVRALSVLHFVPPLGDHPGLCLYRASDDTFKGRLWFALELFRGDLGAGGKRFIWEGLSPRATVRLGNEGKLAISTREGTLYTWDTSDPQTPPEPLGNHRGGPPILAAPPNGRWLASANEESLAVWDLDRGEAVWQREDLRITCIALHPQEHSLVCGTTAGQVLEIDAHSGRTKRVLAQHRAALDSVGISPDGTRLASVGYDQRLLVTDWTTAEELWSRPHYNISEVCFSPDGHTLVSSGFVKQAWAVLTWDAMTGQPRAALRGHRGVILGLTFDGDQLYSWGTDGTVRCWDIETQLQTDCYVPSSPC